MNIQKLRYEKESGKIYRGDREAGYINYYGYRIISIGNKRYPAHRLVWYFEHREFPKNQIDHINHNRLDNRIQNLRVVSNQENSKNCPIRKTNKSGYTGISWDKRSNKWRASICHNGKCINLGRYLLIEDAIEARLKANKQYNFHENHGLAIEEHYG